MLRLVLFFYVLLPRYLSLPRSQRSWNIHRSAFELTSLLNTSLTVSPLLYQSVRNFSCLPAIITVTDTSKLFLSKHTKLTNALLLSTTHVIYCPNETVVQYLMYACLCFFLFVCFFFLFLFVACLAESIKGVCVYCL